MKVRFGQGRTRSQTNRNRTGDFSFLPQHMQMHRLFELVQ